MKRISKHQPTRVNVCKKGDLIFSSFDSYSSTDEILVMVKDRIRQKRLSGIFEVSIYQEGISRNKSIRV